MYCAALSHWLVENEYSPLVSPTMRLAGAVAAVGRAEAGREEEHAVGVAVDEAGDRGVVVLVQRVGVLAEPWTNSPPTGMWVRRSGCIGSVGDSSER